jgi:Protein of unknown function (DUF2442)
VSLKEGIAVGIARVKRLGGHRLELTFSDGHVSSVDFGPFLRSSLNPETRQFLDAKRFRQFSLVHGNLVWGDYEMCFAIEDLYEGRIACGKSADKALAVAETRVEYTTKKRRHQ